MEKIIEDYYRYFNENNAEGMLSLVSDDLVHEINESDSEVGIEKFRAFLKTMDTHYQEHLEDIVIMANSKANRVSAEFICHGTYLKSAEGLPPATGQTYKLRVGAFFEVKDQKITRISNYYNLNEWIRQVS